MTLRTYRYFMCENGHCGEERTSENDQPHSNHWESVSVKGLKLIGEDGRGYMAYVCSECNKPMFHTRQP